MQSFYSTSSGQRETWSPGKLKHFQRILIFKVTVFNFFRWVLLSLFCHLTLRTTLSLWMTKCIGYLITIEVLGLVASIGVLARFFNLKYKPRDSTIFSLYIISLLAECLLFSILCRATRGDFTQFSFMMALMELVKILYLAANKFKIHSRSVQLYYLIMIIIVPSIFYLIFRTDEVYKTWMWAMMVAFYNLTFWGTALNLVMDFIRKVKDIPIEVSIVSHYFAMFFIYLAVVVFYLHSYSS